MTFIVKAWHVIQAVLDGTILALFATALAQWVFMRFRDEWLSIIDWILEVKKKL